MNYLSIRDWKKVKTLEDAKLWHLKYTPYFDEKVIDILVAGYPNLIKKTIIKKVHQETEEPTLFIRYLWE